MGSAFSPRSAGRSTTGSTAGTRGTTAWRLSSETGSAASRSRTSCAASPPRCCGPSRRSSTRARSTASARPPSRGRSRPSPLRARPSWARRSSRRGPRNPSSRCCAATSSTCRPAPRSAACSRRSPRNERRVRSRPGRRRSTMHDATQERFGKTAERIGELQDERAADLEQQVIAFVAPSGDERALDSGTGTGALAFALAPYGRVPEVVGAAVVPELPEQPRKRAGDASNVSFVEGDATALPFGYGEFDLAGSLRTLHHLARPGLALAELTRVTRSRGRVLVIDQIAPVDPLAAVELNRFEQARDPTHTRTLADVDLRGLFESNGLVLLRAEYTREQREVDSYLDLAGCEGEDRERAKTLAPPGYTADLGWYLLEKR